MSLSIPAALTHGETLLDLSKGEMLHIFVLGAYRTVQTPDSGKQLHRGVLLVCKEL